MKKEYFFKKAVDTLMGKGETPTIVLSDEAKQSIAGVVTENRPDQLSETPFLGVEKGGQILKVFTSSPSQANSKLRRVSNEGYVIAVDKNQLADQFNKAAQTGELDEVTLLGHLHPSGKTKLEGITYVVDPSDYLLDPSMEDVEFARAFVELNPGSKIKHFGIAANADDGPKMAVWRISDLVRVKRYGDLDNIPKQEINLRK